MPTSAVGSSLRLIPLTPALSPKGAREPYRSPLPCSLSRPRERAGVRAGGFTLLELLVVVAIMAIATAGVAFALRDNSQTLLERDAARLAALLESARAQSRASGMAVRWRPTAEGFRFEGIAGGTLPERWLGNDTVTRADTLLQLGPEPIIGRQAVLLQSASQPAQRLFVATDGVRPFTVLPAGSP